jgi:hypothetical protein
MNRRINILIIYTSNQYPMRATLWDQLYSFRHYSDHNCFYLNLSVRRVPWYLKKIKFDLIVFGTLFLATRIAAEWFEPIREKARPLKSFDAVKIAFPQDEYQFTEVLADFIKEFDIESVFSVAPESEWPKIYEDKALGKVRFHSVLTGYLDDSTVERINRLAKAGSRRDIDIGYRTWRAAPNLGRHGFLRQQIADLFQAKAPELNLVTDISTRSEDTLWGDAWYEFLLNCKYTISVEGGASMLDRDGKIKQRTEAYLAQHPGATFAEVEEACFPGLDGTLKYTALSPRHLEACATRTCQVLVEGKYNDVLVPGRHYIELKRDFGNIDEVLEIIKQDDARDEITERAYREIIESGRYTYRDSVEFILGKSLSGLKDEKAAVETSAARGFFYYWMRMSEFISWIQVALHLHSFVPQFKGKLRRAGVRLFSEEKVVQVHGRIRQAKRKPNV